MVYKIKKLSRKYSYLEKRLSNLSKILNQGKGKNKDSSPGAFSEEVDGNNRRETAYQRAIILNDQSKIEGMGLAKWLDIELPVIFGKFPRRRSVDLIGEMGRKNLLVELKYDSVLPRKKSKARPNTNSPLYALFEVLIYYSCIVRNAKELHRHEIWHIPKRGAWTWGGWESSQILLMVAANKNYWDKWKNCKKWESLRGAILEVIREFKTISIGFFISPDPERPFSKQASKKSRYRPSLGRNAKKPWQKVNF